MSSETGPRPRATAEFRRPIPVRALGRAALATEIAADAAECAAVARRLHIPAVRDLKANATLRRRRDGGIVVHGRVEAVVTQESVASLTPFEALATEEFTTIFVPPGDDAGPEIEVDPTEEEDIETLEGTEIDLGELAVQYLALSLDPYPRAPGEDA